MLDDIDRGLIHALHIDGRAPFSTIAEVLGVSTQTVSRRYRRLCAEASLRVVGLADPQRAGRTQWLLRLTAGPHSAQDLAAALARRADTSWVMLASGGTEIVAVVHTSTADGPAGHALLLHDIPRTAGITAVSAHCVLHTYLGGPTAWYGREQTLDAAQRRRLQPAPAPARPAQQALTPADGDLLAALRRDGRAPLTDLAAATGWSPASVARRLADLRAGGALFFDVDLDAALLGVTTQAMLWMAVGPAHLDHVARTLAGHPELAYVAAVTGPSNLVAEALCPDPAALHRYLIEKVGSLEAIRSLETAPILRTIKAAGPLPSAARTGAIRRRNV
ncbi:AsnC family transcriptional regulator [Streptomyces spinoverrucosus]|uniref:AsnC family transcriptional regulator n=1 Tax=Streptomyces spinoverrucosus TaxID=284043 RepID=A0A4Y3VI42_9ACTN|nr:AsnC family transcriptional regulator [Streptomyces spinoverrucosus]GEC06193.1 AsnC family transcriptional regulator [Streptomyces spinoverrucosus]GHB75282.1 AsnC family transcriptional regulator [Streptomyces spinoverrucosus]